MPKDKWLVSLAKPDREIKGMDVYGKVRKFSKHGHSFTLSDSGEAKELQREFGQKGSGDIIVSKIPNYKPEPGHKYNFTVRKPKDESVEEKRRRMIRDGWVEYSPGKWKKLAQDR